MKSARQLLSVGFCDLVVWVCDVLDSWTKIFESGVISASLKDLVSNVCERWNVLQIVLMMLGAWGCSCKDVLLR